MSFVFAKYVEMKRSFVTVTNMPIQERHIYSHFYSEPPSFLLKSEFIKTCKMNR